MGAYVSRKSSTTKNHARKIKTKSGSIRTVRVRSHNRKATSYRRK